MERFKISNYLKAFPGSDFPSYESLDIGSAKSIRLLVSERFGLPKHIDQLVMVKELDALGFPCEGVNARDADFKMSFVLRAAKIEPREYVYLNWYRYDHIDKLRFQDLDRVLGDIWYPDADDADIFDDSLGWILSIAHHGEVKIARP